MPFDGLVHVSNSAPLSEMKFSRLRWCSYSALAVALGFAGAAHAGSGEPIRFSKPAVPIAIEEKEQEMPKARARGFDFPGADLAQPMVLPPQQPQPFVRMERKDREEDHVPRLLRTPKMFSDPEEEKRRNEAESGFWASRQNWNSAQQSPFSSGAHPVQKKENKAAALSPETDFQWRPEETLERRDESPWNARRNDDDRRDLRERDRERNGLRDHERGHDAEGALASGFNPLTPRREETAFEAHGMRNNWATDLISAAQPKQKPTTAELERRAAFEQLINPNAPVGGKGLVDSLQPVVKAEDASPANLAVPTLGMRGVPQPASRDPMDELNRRHERLRGPVMEDINKKYSATPQKPVTTYQPAYQSPLMRQPTEREFPTRRGY